MKISLALIAALIAGSNSQQISQNNNYAPVSALEKNKQSFACKKAVEVALTNRYFAETIPANFYLIKQGHNPLNQTELHSNEYNYEATTVFQDFDCNQDPTITVRKKAFMNSLHKQTTIVRLQQDR